MNVSNVFQLSIVIVIISADVFVVVMLEIESTVRHIVRIELVLLISHHWRHARILLLIAKVLLDNVE